MILQNDLLKFFYNQQVVVEANKLGLGGGAEEMVGKGRQGRNETWSERNIPIVSFKFPSFQFPLRQIQQMNKILTIKRVEMKRNLKTRSELWWQLSKQETYFYNKIWGLLCLIVVNVSYSLNRIVANLCLLFSNLWKGRLYSPCRLVGWLVSRSVSPQILLCLY